MSVHHWTYFHSLDVTLPVALIISQKKVHELNNNKTLITNKLFNPETEVTKGFLVSLQLLCLIFV